jgi:glycosyltransferase involved in cell wall biosynthesis
MTLTAFTKQHPPYNQCPIIIVDDGSSEPVEAIIDAYRSCLHLTYIRIPRKGRAVARNVGAQTVQHGLLVFCDADRMPSPEFLQAFDMSYQTHGEKLYIGRVGEIYVPSIGQNRRKVMDHYENPLKHRIPQYCRLVYQLYHDNGLCYSAIPWISAFSGNMAIPAKLFYQLGCFDGAFTEWGFEHFELGYRAHQSGVSFHYVSVAENVHLAHPRAAASYVEYIKESHALFYRKHPQTVVASFLDFMLGAISINQLEQVALTGLTSFSKRDDSTQYVRITNFQRDALKKE